MNIPGEKTFRPTLARDNFWVIGNIGANVDDAQAVWWVMDGDAWSEDQLDWLDASLERMAYFGRAEAITEIQRVEQLPTDMPVNCVLEQMPSSGSVPVLAPTGEATLEQVQAVTDDPLLANSTVPPGACWLHARRPARPPVRLPRSAPRMRESPRVIQFAIGTRVSPSRKAVVVLTQRFRGRVIREFLAGSWRRANATRRAAARLLTGKEADGSTLRDHRHPHARFGIFFDPETGKAARLLVWRDQPFSDDEHRAILQAAEQELQLSFHGAGTRDPWTVRLVPLDSRVSPPMGFGPELYRRWRTVTPYVPPRHMYDRRGRVRSRESLEEQLRLDLSRRGYNTTGLSIVVDDEMTEWTQIHRPRRNRDDPTNTVRRGYHVALTFDMPVRGPISLGHSAHFGLGLFVVADDPS